MKKSGIYLALYYISIILAAVYLYRYGSVSFNRFNIDLSLFISVFFLTAGFFTYPLSLKMVLDSQNTGVSYKSSFLLLGNTIFSKYIPGKVAMIYSIAYRLNKENRSGMAANTYGVLLFKFIIIISGLITGFFTVALIKNISPYIKIASLGLIMTGLAFMISKKAFVIFSKAASFILKKEIILRALNFRILIKTIAVSVLFWILWGLGIYYFVDSLGIELQNSSALIFIYPFSICVGILAFIFPGGIGIREGVLAALIVATGNELAPAAEISVLSRIWFLSGEIIFFLISILFSYIAKKSGQE
ncbi:MAG: hypothetical protein R6V47_00465 [Candidatus Delongbacteria bacterium]